MSASEPFDGTRDQGGHHNRFLTQRERQEKILTLRRHEQQRRILHYTMINTATYETYVKRVSQEMHDDKATSTEPVIRYTWGTDAGFYRLIPQVVAFPKNENELATLVKHAREMKLPVTFRAAGTSLSGQAITDSILIVIGEKWNKHRVLDEG